MKLSQLQTLCALEQEPAFARVAEKRFLSQPALSTSIQALEQELACTLLIRNHKGVQFTDEGKLALEKAHAILDCISEIRALAETAPQSLPDHIIIGSNTHACLEILLEVFLKIEAQNSRIELNLQEIDETLLLHQLMYGTLDFALFQINSTHTSEELEKLFQTHHLAFLELTNEPLIVMVHNQHPLHNQKTISVQELFPFPFATAHCKTDQSIFSALQSLGYQQNSLYLQDITCLDQLISATNYWTLIPLREALRHQSARNCPFSFLQLQDFSCSCAIGWLRQNQKLAEEEQSLIQFLKESLSNA